MGSKISRHLGTWALGTKLVIDVRGAEVVPKGSMVAFVPPNSRRAIITDSKSVKLRGYERDIREIATRWMDRLALPCASGQPFELLIVFYLARPQKHFDRLGLRPDAPPAPMGKPDVDKLQRALLDALTGIVFEDDARIVRIVAEKRYATPSRDIGVWAECRVLPATRAQAALLAAGIDTPRAE